MKVTLFSGETITIKMSQWEPPKPENEEAPASAEPSVTYLNLASSQSDHPINGLMGRLAFQASSYTFTGIPVEISEVADITEPKAEEPEATIAPTGTQPSSDQPEIKQHIDGNSVIFEVTPPKKTEEDKTEN